jgi:hypothetical protein
LQISSQRPVRESNPSHLLDRQAGTPASSQGKHRTQWIPFYSYSKAGRIRTHSAGFGDQLLSQEHDLVFPHASRASEEKVRMKRKGQGSNLQALFGSTAFQAVAVAGCRLAPPFSNPKSESRNPNHEIRNKSESSKSQTVAFNSYQSFRISRFEFRVSEDSCPGRTRTFNRPVNSRLLYHLSYKAIESGWSDLNRRSPAPQAGGFPGFPTS